MILKTGFARIFEAFFQLKNWAEICIKNPTNLQVFFFSDLIRSKMYSMLGLW